MGDILPSFFPVLPNGFTLAMMIVVVFCAGFVRGFSGFGFSAIVVSAMALVMDPLVVVAMVMIFEIIASVFQVKNAAPHIDKPQVSRLLAGAVIGMPIGVSILVALDVTLVRICIAILVFGLCLVLLSGWSLKRPPGAVGQFAVGAGSGFANSAAIGGLPVGLFLTAQNTSPVTFRANMIFYLMMLDIIGIGVMAWHDRFSFAIVVTTLCLLPVMFVGVYMGSRHFFATPPASFRKMIIIMLMGLSLVSMAKSFL